MSDKKTNMELDLNKQFTGLDKSPCVGDAFHMGKILGNDLATSTKGDPVKLLDWAFRLFNGEPIYVDKSDREMLKKHVHASGIMNLGKGQILSEIYEQCEKESPNG